MENNKINRMYFSRFENKEDININIFLIFQIALIIVFTLFIMFKFYEDKDSNLEIKKLEADIRVMDSLEVSTNEGQFKKSTVQSKNDSKKRKNQNKTDTIIRDKKDSVYKQNNNTDLTALKNIIASKRIKYKKKYIKDLADTLNRKKEELKARENSFRK